MLTRLLRISWITAITLLLTGVFWWAGTWQGTILVLRADVLHAQTRYTGAKMALDHTRQQYERTVHLTQEAEKRIREAKKLTRERAYDKLSKFLDAVEKETELQKSGQPYVVVSLFENKLALKRGTQLLKEYRVSLGSGKILESEKRKWIFETPRGLYPIRDKKENPVWIKPDWAFIEKSEPVPPPDSPLRKIKGHLGKFGVYLGGGEGYLIHAAPPGEEDTIGLNVSHGCIRMRPEDLEDLYNNVQINMNVLIR